MSAPRERVMCHGFDLRLENGFAEIEAREVIDRVLATAGDRVAFVMDRAGAPGADGRPTRIFVKAEFRRPHQPLGKRLKPSRAIAEGRGYRAFAAAALPVARMFAFGEQSRLRPRAGAVVITEKIRGRNAEQTWLKAPDVAIALRVARIVARIHAAGLVHGDAVMRNFVLVPVAEYVVDLPGWRRFSADLAERDVALFVGSAMKIGADGAAVVRMLDEYAAPARGAGSRLSDGWRERVLRAADEYRRHLIERDATRPERRARKAASAVRPGERST